MRVRIWGACWLDKDGKDTFDQYGVSCFWGFQTTDLASKYFKN